jgi:hypothetical protein
MFVCIRKKVPLLLRLVMDFVGTSAEAAELKEVVNEIPSGNRSPHTCFGRSSVEECEDDCARERNVSGWEVRGEHYLPMGWGMNET